MKRRTFLKKSSLTALSVSVFGAVQWNGTSFVGDSPTTTDILGPFYRPNAPMRSNLIPANSMGKPVNLSGIIFKDDGRTPVNNALVEIWHCDDHEHYDNDSDDYMFRGALKTGANGNYNFKTIMPVPYKAAPDVESSWRPAHIHLRVSVPGQQDLITQLYFKGGKYLDTDPWASSPQAVNRILNVKATDSGALDVVFDVVMSKEFPLENEVYKKIAGLYNIEGGIIEFLRMDDLLYLKLNGQLYAGLKYIGNNTFEGGIGLPKVTFELPAKGDTKATIVMERKTYSGARFMKYKD